MSVKLNTTFIRTRAAELGLTLRELAKESDIGEATMYRLNAGQGFNTESLEGLAKGLQCNPLDLIAVEGDYPAPLMVASPVTSGHAQAQAVA